MNFVPKDHRKDVGRGALNNLVVSRILLCKQCHIFSNNKCYLTGMPHKATDVACRFIRLIKETKEV